MYREFSFFAWSESVTNILLQSLLNTFHRNSSLYTWFLENFVKWICVNRNPHKVRIGCRSFFPPLEDLEAAKNHKTYRGLKIFLWTSCLIQAVASLFCEIKGDHNHHIRAWFECSIDFYFSILFICSSPIEDWFSKICCDGC